MQLIYDSNAQLYVLIFQPQTCPAWYGLQDYSLYYITSKSLANPSWSEAKIVGGTGAIATNPIPAGTGCPLSATTGFYESVYISIIDHAAPGFNFETTTGTPYLYYVRRINALTTINRIQLKTAYATLSSQ